MRDIRRSPRSANPRARGFGLAVLALSALVAFAACGQAAQPAATLAPAATAAPTAAPTAAATPTRAATPAPTPAAAKETSGTITKIGGDGREITVKTADGKEVTFEISGSRTKIEGSITSRSGFKVGQTVTVTGPEGGEAAKVVVK